MKQQQFVFKDLAMLDEKLEQIRDYYDSNLFYGMLIHIFTEILDRDMIGYTCRRIEEVLPEAEYVGCSSNGNIVNGDFSGNSFSLSVSYLEYPDSRVRVLAFPMSSKNQADVAEEVVRFTSDHAWVKGIEFLVTIRGMSMSGLCDGLSALPLDVQVFGGGAFSEDINNNEACVFSKGFGYMEKGIVFVLAGGDNLHFRSSYVSGWKPLGSYLDVTAADGYLLKELNGLPAYDTYYKYLRIKNDENFFYHTLEFPFLYRIHGIDIMRAPTASLPDGSLVMTSDMESDVRARLAYGDPWTILRSAKRESLLMEDYNPQCVLVFSCAGRRTFWGNDKVGQETKYYQKLAPTSGFYTSSEFLRTGRWVIQHNVTQVVVAIREGDPEPRSKKETISEDELTDVFEGKIPMINRMVTFINATMEELEEANSKLASMAITDGLTGLYNRVEIQRRITEQIEKLHTRDVYLIMLDLDDFKKVNDTYGHKEGDNVLIRLSGILKETMVEIGENCSAGRWGGEEFMILIHSCSRDVVLEQAERIRKTMERISFEHAGRVTVSIGVTRAQKQEPADDVCNRVDDALYQAKRYGKNRIVVV